MRDGNIRNLPFVDGYVLRTEWDTLEPTDGVFDFTIITNIFAKLPAGQKLSLLLGTGVLPSWLNTAPGVVTYTAGSPATTQPVPWNPAAQERFRLLLVALGNHLVDGVPLRDHPRLAAVDLWIPGLKSGIRSLTGAPIRDIPGYTRPLFEGGVLTHLANVTDNFPNVPAMIGFWTYTDTTASPAAWESLRQAILAQHNGTTRPRVGFWMENLAANRAAADAEPWTGLPNHSFTAALYDSQDQTYVGYQVLGSWSRPFSANHVDNNLNGSPEDGMDYGFNDFQCRYYEHYQADVDSAAMQPEFQRWHDFLAALPAPPSTNTAPTISALANQTNAINTTVGPLAFTVGDAETTASNLVITAASSNPTLLPTNNIAFGGSGSNRTVTLAPAAGQTGTSTVTLIVSDGSLTAQTSFTLTVFPPLPIGGGDPPAPVSGGSYTHTFTVTGATGTVTWTLASGTLPPGLTLGSDGVLSGTPTTPGIYDFTVQATDSLGLTGTQSVTLTVSSGPQTVASLAALHTNGQTYLSWSEVADSAATYRIYRSASAFTSTTQFSSANLIGTAAADSSFDERLSALRSTNYFYRITAAGPDLTDTQGLFVHTTTADGAAYYAVTAVVGGVEQIALDAGQNTTGGVNETVAMPEPVFQRNVTVNSRTVEVYAHWVGATATAFYPAMGNENSVAHHIGLVRNGTAATHSLLIRPHARMGSFLSTVTGTNDPEQWVLTLDDWMPNSIQNTFWYGYHETFDIDSGGPQGTSGTVHDYTTRRAVWEIEWATRTLPLDLNRLYMTGHSMGGIGSHFLSLMMPGKIAAIWTTSAKYDFSFLTDPNPSNIWNDGANERATSGDLMWGTVAQDLMSSEGVPVYDRLNAGYLVEAFRGVDQPVMVAFHGKNDNVVGWAEKLGFYNAMNANRHGGMFFFDSGVHNRSGGEFVPEQSVNVLNRYRLDQSYPAFSNSSANGNPGDGNATNGDAFGSINGNLDWDTATIVDTASQWQIRLTTIALAPSTGTIAAPASATVDVTPRRLQAFDHTAGRTARYEVRDAGNALLTEGLVVADADGLFTVPAVPLNPAGTTLTLSTSSPEITSDSPLPGASLGSAYVHALAATAGVMPYTWSVSAGSPPGGVALAVDGTLSGTPTAGGTFQFTARVTDAVGASATRDFSLTVSSPPKVESPTFAAVTTTSATLGGNVVDDGMSAITERGVVYSATSVNGDPLLGGEGVDKAPFPGTTGVFTVDLANLASGTTYSFKAYATNGEGTGYSDVARLTTDTPVVFENGVAHYLRDIAPGGSQRFLISLADTRFVSFEATGTAPIRAELFDDAGNLLASFDGDGDFTFDKPIGPGEFALRVFRLADGGGTLDYELAVDASIAAFVRPDVAVGASLSRLIGVGVYTAPSNQRTTLKSARARRVVGHASVSNRGNLSDVMVVKATQGDALFRVIYRDPAGNITAKLVGGSYRTPTMDLNSTSLQVRVEVVPIKRRLAKKLEKRTVYLKKVRNLVITAKSDSDRSLGDSATIQVRTK